MHVPERRGLWRPGPVNSAMCKSGRLETRFDFDATPSQADIPAQFTRVSAPGSVHRHPRGDAWRQTWRNRSGSELPNEETEWLGERSASSHCQMAT